MSQFICIKIDGPNGEFSLSCSPLGGPEGPKPPPESTPTPTPAPTPTPTPGGVEIRSELRERFEFAIRGEVEL